MTSCCTDCFHSCMKLLEFAKCSFSWRLNCRSKHWLLICALPTSSSACAGCLAEVYSTDLIELVLLFCLANFHALNLPCLNFLACFQRRTWCFFLLLALIQFVNFLLIENLFHQFENFLLIYHKSSYPPLKLIAEVQLLQGFLPITSHSTSQHVFSLNID